MSIFNIVSKNELDTLNIGKSIASVISNKELIVLTGELGSGKTKFTEGFLSFFGLEDEISSPTFTIVNEYISDSVNIYHFDVYRLNNSLEFLDIGGEEYFKNGICIIEWGEIIKDILPKDYIQINFERDYHHENTRIIKIVTSNEKYDSKFKYLEK